VTPAQELRERLGVGLAIVVAAAGWALTVMVLVRGGGYSVVVPGLVPALPIAVVGTVTALAAWRRSVNVAVWLAVLTVTGVLVSLVVVWLWLRGDTWNMLLVQHSLWGRDFRDGLYDPAAAFSVARSGWPPLTLLVGLPFTLVEFSTAYVIHVALVTVAAVGSAILSAVLAIKVLPPDSLPRETGLRGGGIDVQSLGVVFAFWLITSYGFMYELERGNVNLYALVFSLLAVWSAVRLPRSPWWPAAALAVAINLKLYPAILVVLLFWRYRLRAVVPVLVTNAVLLLVAGPTNSWRLLKWLTTMTPDSRIAVHGEMGAAGTASVLRFTTEWAPSWIAVPLYIVPLALWAASAFLLLRRGWSDRRAVLFAAACVPLMAVIPTLSNDYKLVLFVFPLAVLAVAIAGADVSRSRLGWCLGFGALAWLLVFMARSSQLRSDTLIGSKYSLVVVAQALLLVTAWRLDRVGAAETAGEDTQGRRDDH
jgi:hypothetical protein